MQVFPFQRLLELARTHQEKAVHALQTARLSLQHAEAKLEKLADYQRDYHQQFQRGQQKGMAAVQLHDYRAFLSKLSLAVQQQQQQVEQEAHQVDSAQHAWQAADRRLKAFEALESRHQKAERSREARQDQRLMDEFSSRHFSVRPKD